MDSTASVKAIWKEGDSCLAPNPKDGILQEAKIQRVLSTSNNNHAITTALVIFTDQNKQDEEKEVTIPVAKLLKPVSNQLSHEKPLFPSIQHPRVAVPLVLDHVAGETVPYTINRYLRDYQREGIKFLYNNYIRSGGCILGDDMGLGKTVQIIGFLSAVLRKTGTWEDIENNRPQFLLTQAPSKQGKANKVFLIIAPLSVLYNWKDELETWGHFQCLVIHGPRKEEELARIKNGRLEIALTTYETLRLCLDRFNSIDWTAVIVDEAHKLKNPKSQITRAMKELKCKVRIGLTGTILQNNLEELWCVMDWAIPGCLGTLGHFKNKFSDPIEQGQRHSATKRALAIGRKTVRALASKISRWFLRRTKAIIKDQLPKKDDRVVYCSLTDFQQTVYETVLESEDVALLLRSADKCDCQSGRTQRSCCYRTNSDGVQVRRLYFSYLAILRKVANHVALLQSTDGTSEKQKTIVSAICNKVFQKFPDFMQRCKEEAFEAISDPMYSGKMKVLQKLLSLYMKKRDKVLIFSLSTKLLDVLQSYCMAEGLDFSRLDGTTKSKERLTIVKEFNSSPHTNLCLVSTMAGGLGLNFVGANVVVLFDPTWNPANDLQAIDRAYRIGQCRDVTVLRLISLGTVEEIIYLRQVYKQQLQSSVVERECARRYFEAVQGADGQKGELFGLKNLFRLQTQGTCLTRCLLEREGRVEAGVMTTSTHAGVEREDESTETSEVGELPPSDVSKPSGRTANENMAASMIPKGVLDFSSGSDEDDGERRVKRKAMEPYREDGQDGAGSPASRLSLLQCGFSRLLQGVAGRASHQEEDSSQSEAESRKGGSSEGHDVVDAWSSGKEITSAGSANLSGTPGNECSARVLELKTSTWDTSRGSDKEEGGLLDSRRRRGGSTEGESDRTGRQNAAHEKWMGAKRRLGRESDKIYRSDKKELNKAQAAPPGRKDLEGDSDESDDLDIAVKPRVRKEAFNRQEGETKRDVEKYRADRTRKRRSIRARSKRSEDIEAFTSSDEEHTPVKRGTSKTMFLTSPKTQTRRDGTIDSVLGAVSQVLYTHSNQCVVGGSKAEERLSSAAARDVFERKMYSQLPANHLGTQESLSEDGLVSRPGPSAGRADAQGEAKRVESLRVQHPVAFTRQAIHYSRDTTFIIGQTPPAIRRKQLEQMAARFNMSSVHQFAEEVLRCSSTQRLAWLRQYYTSLNQPKLAEMVTVQFPEPDAAQSNSQSAVHPSSSMPEHKDSSWKAGEELGSQIQKTSVFEPPTSSRNPHRSGVHASEQVKETVSKTRERKRIPSVSSSGSSRAAAHLYSDKMGQRDDEAPTSLVLSGVRSTTPVKPIAPDKRTRLESSPRVPEAVGGQPGKACPPSCHSEATSTTSARSLLTDLIGDTSILDDLFRPTLRGTRPAGPRSETPLTTHPHSITSPSSTSRATRSAAPSTSRTPSLPATPQKSAAGRKDFWDILNEGSEESISMLTDMSALERACVRTSHPAHNRSGEKGGVMTGLWKMNDKFLWKK